MPCIRLGASSFNDWSMILWWLADLGENAQDLLNPPWIAHTNVRVFFLVNDPQVRSVVLFHIEMSTLWFISFCLLYLRESGSQQLHNLDYLFNGISGIRWECFGFIDFGRYIMWLNLKPLILSLNFWQCILTFEFKLDPWW